MAPASLDQPREAGEGNQQQQPDIPEIRKESPASEEFPQREPGTKAKEKETPSEDSSKKQEPEKSSTTKDGESFPGDDLISDPVMVYHQKRKIKASASEVYPWLLQIGKSRGGWYLPGRVEKLIPERYRAARHIDERWQKLIPGERIPDYGFSKHDFFVVERVEPPHVIILRSERYGCKFSWALLLREIHDTSKASAPVTEVHLRFRGRIQAVGVKQKVIVKGGEFLDHLSTAPMLAGLAERCERPTETHPKGDKAS